LTYEKLPLSKDYKEIEVRIDQRHSQQNQTAHAIAFLKTLRAVGNPQGVAARLQIFEAIHLKVVYRNLKKVQLFCCFLANEYLTDWRDISAQGARPLVVHWDPEPSA
jgi:hypothetical protein